MIRKSASTSAVYYPGQFDTLLTFLGEAKFNLKYWSSAKLSTTGLCTLSSIQKFSLGVITLLWLRWGLN